METVQASQDTRSLDVASFLGIPVPRIQQIPTVLKSPLRDYLLSAPFCNQRKILVLSFGLDVAFFFHAVLKSCVCMWPTEGASPLPMAVGAVTNCKNKIFPPLCP